MAKDDSPLPPLPRSPRVPGLRPKAQKTEADPDRQAAFNRGISAESLAAAWLIGKGYRILARRFRSGAGEIDIVAGRRHTIIFVEVKARASLDEAAESVTPRQRMRIATAAEIWLGQNPQVTFRDLRFDAILIAPGKLPRHIQGAFET
ncbi:MAG: YraN family protein [Pseudolabrys sp.]|nr:YraN family protein [Pseudolabrys sp.]